MILTFSARERVVRSLDVRPEAVVWAVPTSDEMPDRTEIIDWARANGIDPRRVLDGECAVIETSDGPKIRYNEVLAHAAPFADEFPHPVGYDDRGRPLTVARLAPLLVAAA